MYQFRSVMPEDEKDIIAYEIMDGTEVFGLVQYSYVKGSFFKKNKL